MKQPRLIQSMFIIIFLLTGSMTILAQGGTLAPNGSGSGSMTLDTVQDWWQITTTVDGALEVTTLASGSLDIDLYIFNYDKSVQLAGYDISTGATEKTHHTNLGPGTYFVKALRYDDAGSYSITSQFTPASYENDPETNDTVLQATTLGSNSSDTGHLGYYYNGSIDDDDWWKVTTPADGRLMVATVSDSTLDIDLFIFDTDGETELVGYDISTGINETTHHDYLMPGTYYIKAKRYSGYGAYTIASEFVATAFENDTEDNDSTTVAQVLLINSNDTGHLGFRSNEEFDNDDYWSVQVPADGKLMVTTVSDSTIDVDLFLIDDDGETQIASYDISTGINETTHHNSLTPGTYFVHAERYDGYGSYTISTSFTPTARLNDHEPNGEVETAASAVNQTTLTGHLGHYDSGAIDNDDYFMITVPIEWDTLYVHSISDSTLDIDMVIYGAGGTSQVASGGRVGIEEWATKTNLAEATYYLKMHRWGGYGSYAFIVSGSTAARPDQGPVAVEIDNTRPDSFTLSAPYPNPFNPSVAMTFSVPEECVVRLTVYDMLGREVSVLVDELQGVGTYTAVWDGYDRFSNRAGAGVYLFRMQAGRFIETKRAVLVK